MWPFHKDSRVGIEPTNTGFADPCLNHLGQLLIESTKEWTNLRKKSKGYKDIAV